MKLSPEEQLEGRRLVLPRKRRCRPRQRATVAVCKCANSWCEGQGTEVCHVAPWWGGHLVMKEKATVVPVAACW